jgi:hypothetical protein
MASKRFKDETCVYCATPGAATTADHVFARQFFPLDKRDGLPKAPACEACNRAKSALEHYLTTVLPFAGRHADALRTLSEMVPARLAANRKLSADLDAQRSHVVQQVNGRFVRAMTLPFDSEKLSDLMAYVARGLAFHDFGVVIPAGHHVRAGMLRAEGAAFLEQVFAWNGRRTGRSLGDGVFDYAGLQSVEDPHLTVWKFRVMGGIQTAGDPTAPDEWPEFIWATTSKAPSLLDL